MPNWMFCRISCDGCCWSVTPDEDYVFNCTGACTCSFYNQAAVILHLHIDLLCTCHLLHTTIAASNMTTWTSGDLDCMFPTTSILLYLWLKIWRVESLLYSLGMTALYWSQEEGTVGNPSNTQHIEHEGGSRAAVETVSVILLWKLRVFLRRCFS